VEKDPEKGWLTFKPSANQYRVGSNEVSFRAINSPAGAKSPTDVIAVEVHVNYN
jgi:hypothetical protein